MKKCILIIVLSIALLILFLCCPHIYGFDDLEAKARADLPLADAATIKIQFAGTLGKEDSVLFWFIAGKEGRSNYYLPMEFKYIDRNMYLFIESHKPIASGMDICALQWKQGYCFLVNNPDCTAIQADDIRINIPKNRLPYLEYVDFLPSEFYFLDAEGNEIPLL